MAISKARVLIATAVVFAAIGFFSLSTNQNAYAGVGSGSGSTGGGPGCNRSGINGCPWTSNGYGWFALPIDGSGGAPNGNGRWSQAVAQCSLENARTIMAFVVFTGEQTWNTAWIYNYDTSEFSMGWYNDWSNISAGDVQARFNSLPWDQRIGYTFGSNVGWFCYDHQPRYNFTTTGTTTVNRSTAGPGDRLTWTHTLTNNGPTNSPDIYSQTVNGGFSNGSFNGVRNGQTGAMGVGWVRTHGSYAVYDVQQADVGNNLCQQLQWDPTNSSGGRDGRAANACVYIPYNFSLVPSITSPADGTIVESDQDTINVVGQVTNNGPTKSGTGVNWRITQINYAPSVTTIPNRGGGTGGDPCAYFTGESACNILNQGNEAGGFAYPDSKSYTANNGQLSNNPVGTKICFVLSVNRYNAASMGNANAWRHSALNCLIVGKKPKVQVWGGGVSAGKVFNGTSLQSSSKIATSLTTKSTKSPTTPAYNSSMITGLWPTGVNNSRAKLPGGSPDPHWQLVRVDRSASYPSVDHCQQGPFPRAATVIDTNQVSVGSNDAWKVSLSDGAWIGANQAATNDGTASPTPSGCSYPAMSNTVTGPAGDAAFDRAATWVFRLNEGFNIGGCVDPATVRLSMQFSADDEAQVVVNGQVVADFGSFRTRGTWPSTPVSYTTQVNPTAYRTGNNTLEIRVKSAWQYTGMLVGGNFAASAECSSIPTSNIFGSWSEYGISAPSTINLMASSSGLSGGSTSPTQSSWSGLTFASRYSTTIPSGCNTIRYGCYSSAKTTLPDPSSTFPYATAIEQSGSSWNLSTLIKGRNTKPSAAVTTLNLTSNPTTLGSGEWLVINAPNATVNITSNLRYTSGSISQASQIPQLIIIAGRINIASNVTQVDAWLIAKNGSTLDGRINTCSTTNTGTDLPITQSLSASLCSEPLRVNGPVVANMLYLRRTAGSGVDAQSGDPAEVFNLRPDAYIWAQARTEALGALNTTYTVELPPRY